MTLGKFKLVFASTLSESINCSNEGVEKRYLPKHVIYLTIGNL